MIPPSLAVISLPLIVLILFQVLNARLALCISIIGSYLFMPERVGIDLPLLPALNKDTIPGIVALLVVAARYGEARRQGPGGAVAMAEILPGWLPRSRIGKGLLAIIVTGPFFTVLTNGDSVVIGDTVLRALRPYDAVAGVATTLTALLPLLLARKILATENGHRTLLIVMAVMGFAYSFLAAYEIRMSPQLNLHVYGYRGAAWRQHLRGDGFRPFVFLHHGLWLAIFLACSTLACFACFRAMKGGRKLTYVFMGFWVLVVLLFSRSFGAFVIAFLLAPIVLLLTVRMQLILAAALAMVVLLYPAMRGGGLIPVDWVVSKAAAINPDRAASLQFRLNNEDILLDKANNRPLFGWGGWRRARVYNENGRDISTTDGRWIITVGEQGWYGYVGSFGLMALPILMLMFRRHRYQVGVASSGLCLVMVANMIDLIPNGTLTMVTWLVAGALLGSLEVQRAESGAPSPAPSETGPPTRRGAPARPPGLAAPAYTRFPSSPPSPNRSRI